MSITCYNPQIGIDDIIASKIPGWNKHISATLRGMYNDSHNAILDTSDLTVAAQKLVAYRGELSKSNFNSITKGVTMSGTKFASPRVALKKSYDAETRFHRVSMLTRMFSDIVDDIINDNPNLSRNVVLKGFTSKGQKVLGQFAIFEEMFDTIFSFYADAMEDGNTYDAAEYLKIINNWSSLITLVRDRLRDTEGIKLGDKLDYVDVTTEGDYGKNNLQELFDISETKREGWQEETDKRSAFGSIGKEVRRILSNIQELDKNGKGLEDDLGYPLTLDPITSHQRLLEILRGMTSSDSMMNILNKAASQGNEWLLPIIDALNSNPEYRTKFYVDFALNFQPYSMLIQLKKKGNKLVNKILNRSENVLEDEYEVRIKLHIPVDSKLSVYDTNGNINWKNLQSVRELTEEYFGKDGELATPKFWAKGTSFFIKQNVLQNITGALGIDVDTTTLQQIMRDSKELRFFTKAIKEFTSKGITRLPKGTLDAMKEGRFDDIPKSSYEEFFNFTSNGQTPVKEKINKMLKSISTKRELLRMESWVRTKDRNGKTVSLSSNVLPSYLGDMVADIKGFVKNEDINGLKRWIEANYLGSSYFMDEGEILNTWLKELYEGGIEEDNFAANLDFQRALGDENVNFENFTSKQHAIDMMKKYSSDYDQSKSNYRLYPVFILGDSGVSKYIKAKHYSENDILKGLYNVYRQEKRRQALVKAANEKMATEGISLIANLFKTASTFTMLPFLNEDYKAADGTVGKYANIMGTNPNEQSVTDAINTYMNDSVSQFKDTITKLGVLSTTTENGKSVYKYFKDEVKGKTTIDDIIKDFYWNTKFATIQQLQMMTIDVGYYKDTKDLQKRYKEIHAPGTKLDVTALDVYNQTEDGSYKKYSEDGIERCIYFNEIQEDVSSYNKEFMESIRHYHKDNPEIIAKYEKGIKSTDGQGYRTLDSYRKVMGMAGKWTPEMELVYNEIKNLRRDVITTEDIDRIANLSVVFQPIKPYMFTIEHYKVNSTDELLIPVQHKYAEAVLIPELLPSGSKIRHLAEWMEDNGIDMVGSEECVKVGKFGLTNISKVTDRNSLENSLNNNLEYKVHKLSYKDYRIQTNVPEHINSSQLFGTQLRKLVMSHIDMSSFKYAKYFNNRKVNLGGKIGYVNMNGRNLVSFYNSLIVSNILDSFKQFKDSTSSIEKISEILSQNVINNSREVTDALIAYSLTEDGDFLLPLFEGGLEHNSSSALMSIYKKNVNKQRIKGGSAVQVSAMGIKGYEESGGLKFITDVNNPNNILYAETEMPFDLSYTDVNGNEIPLKFSDWCNDDGTLKLDTSNELDINLPENKLYQSYFTVDDNGNRKYYRPLIETVYPDILSTIAYRIPTEREYSMMNLRITRFSSKTAGGTIRVPSQGVTIAGFDFK